MIVMCSCGRVKVAYSDMVQGGSVIFWARAVDKDPSQPGTITHQYCPECAEKLRKEADKLRGGA